MSLQCGNENCAGLREITSDGGMVMLVPAHFI